jgi:small subunit ribosomal protein S16
MATRIRLQRHGKKGKPFFHIVAADSRSKRDGRFIEKLGTYDPTKNPAVINLKFENTLSWVQKGAELTNTARAILSYKGILYKNHLLKGVVKGALTEADVEKKFDKWLKEKEAKVQSKIDGLSKSADKLKSDKLKSETAAKEARAAAIIEKNTPEPEEAPEEVAAAAPVEAAAEEAAPVEAAAAAAAPVEAATEEAAPEAPAAEEAASEAPAAETTEDSDKKEAPSAE